MFKETEIPDYAMQPAKELKVYPCQGIFNEKEYNCLSERQTQSCVFEEDILVPDIKPDMAEILLMGADCHTSPDEKMYAAGKEDLLNIAVSFKLQTLYRSLESNCPISICSSLQHIHQWKMKFAEESKVYFDCSIEKITFSIVNERKFRVRMELLITAEVYAKKKFLFFQGIEDSNLQTRSHEKEIEILLMTKRDEMAIEHQISLTDKNAAIEEILKDDYCVIENYRQIMKDKIVVNGFILAKFLCRCNVSAAGTEEDSPVNSLFTLEEKVEFTQFIPVEKKARKDFAGKSQAKYILENMNSQITTDDESGQKIISMKGRIKSRVDLFESVSENIVCDAYDLNSQLEYSIYKQNIYSLKSSFSNDINIRNMFSVAEKETIKNILYCQCSSINCDSSAIDENGTIAGEAEFTVLWEDSNSKISHSVFKAPFKTASDTEYSIKDFEHCIEKLVKSLKCDRVSEHQIEISAVLSVYVKLVEADSLELITEPRFIKGARGKEYPIAMIRKKENETLWDLAKKHHTTVESICLANDIKEGEPVTKRLLIAK